MITFRVFCLLITIIPTILNLECSTFKANEIKMVTFDAYAALFNTQNSLRNNAMKLLQPKLSIGVIESFMDCWVTYYSGAMYADPSIYEEPFEGFMLNGLQTCEKSLELTNITKDDKANLLLAWTFLEPWPNTEETLKYLQRMGYKLALLSNGSEKSLAALAKNSLKEVKFDYFFGSTIPRCFKPKAAMYAQTERAGLKKEEILHVAGAGMDVGGSRSYGMFNYFNQIIDQSDDPFDKGVEPCEKLHSISEILQFLVKLK